MNLHQIASGVIAAVNPFQPVVILHSTGYSTAATGRRVPTYAAPVTASGQVQELSSRDLRQLEGLNIQGSSKAIYLNGFMDGVVRLAQKGGDLVQLQDGTWWLTTNVLEAWPDWVKISVTQQINGPP